MKKIAVVILNWNGWRDTLACLQSVSELLITNYQLLITIVDNGSTDESVRNIKNQISKIKNTKQKSNIQLIENKENLGYAEGNNVGIRKALTWGAEYVILLNNDTLVDKNLVSELLGVMEEDKKIGVSGPKIYFAPGFEFHKSRYKKEDLGKVIWYAGGIIDWKNVYFSHQGVDEIDKGQYDIQGETDFVSGCCMMIKKQVFGRIGLLDPKYFLYLEDADFCVRARKIGFKIIYTPRVHLWHKNAASSEKPGSAIHQYYQTRNRLYFSLKYAPFRSKIALFRESLRFILKKGIKRKACLDFYSARFGRRPVTLREQTIRK